MTHAPPSRWIRTGVLALGSATAGAAVMAFAQMPGSDFVAAMAEAMERMHRDMAVESTGDPDVDFAAMMIPHHQGGIDMAVAVLRHSRNDQIRRLAQEIIVEQQQEIAALRLAVGEPLPASYPAPTHPPAMPAGEPSAHHHGG